MSDIQQIFVQFEITIYMIKKQEAMHLLCCRITQLHGDTIITTHHPLYYNDEENILFAWQIQIPSTFNDKNDGSNDVNK